MRIERRQPHRPNGLYQIPYIGDDYVPKARPNRIFRQVFYGVARALRQQRNHGAARRQKEQRYLFKNQEGERSRNHRLSRTIFVRLLTENRELRTENRGPENCGPKSYSSQWPIVP